jgi:hypothetical protein
MNQTIESRIHDAATGYTITPTDRILILVDHHAELARRSAGSWVDFRLRVLRRDRQAKFARAWGLR